MYKRFLLYLAMTLVMITCFSCAKKKKTNMLFEFSSNPTTGFDWVYEIGEGNGMLELIKDDYKSNAEDGMVGAGGTRTFIFKGTKEGKKNIIFTYKRNWEGGETAYDVVYEIEIDKNLNMSCLNKFKGQIESDVDLEFFPNPSFSE